jgi:RadC-like JAB domain
MHPYPDEILPPPEHPHATRAGVPAGARPGAAVRLVRDGPVPTASCPHCGGRLELSTVGARWQVRGPSDVADRLTVQLGSLEREELHVIVLNTRNVVIDQERVYQGNVSASLVRVGELFRRAVELHASAVILVHNHPSGEPKPSLNDLQLTTEAIRAGQLLDIMVLDHLIIGGGTFASLRDFGVVFEGPRDGHAARERRGPWWRDPRYSAFKSAVQKETRRGSIDKAVAAGAALARLPGGRAMLGRRLTVIAAEDVGWQFIPAVGRVVKECESLPGDTAVPQLLAVTAGLASLQKNREAAWLATTAWGGRRVPAQVSAAALRQALETGRHQDAVAISFTAREQRAWRSGDRVIDALRDSLTDAPALAQEIGRWALWREAQGGYGTAELIASAVIAAIDRPDGLVPDLPVVPHSADADLWRLAWYTADSHTATGGRVLSRQALRLGLPTAMLASLMFVEESIRCGPSEVPARWRDEALTLEAIHGGWGTPESGAQLWASIRDVIRLDIEHELER